jgi:hypothetical protein
MTPVKLIAPFLLSCVAHAGTATLTWTAVTRYTNGSPITSPVTYTVYKNKRFLVSGLSVRRYIVSGLPVGRVCFNVRAVVKGVRSALSNEGCKWVA